MHTPEASLSTASPTAVSSPTLAWRAVAEPRCRLGEGICWAPEREAMLFVDIHGQRILEFKLASGQLREWPSPQRIGWLIPRHQGDGYLAGFQEGFAFIDLDAEIRPRWVARPFGDGATLRLNDAKADAAGRVWAGSLNNADESRPDGVLFCLHPDGRVDTVDEGYCVANGPAISPDGELMLHTDSARQVIHAFDVDAEEGLLKNKRVWRRFNDDEGYPDGMNFDRAGHLWVAHWGAGCISQFDIDGTLRQRFQLPVSNVTNIAFGGERLDRMFVTTAREGLTADQLGKEPLAGALFEITGHGAQGCPARPYGG